jgi:ADP-ribose pyrophosphatase YjhB (NUDIX family)
VVVDARIVRDAEVSYGPPREAFIAQELLPWEFDLITRVCGTTRHHDVTVFAFRDDQVALIHKPSEPVGAYWAPAGGLEAGESMADGVRRETHEETGLDVEVQRYALRLLALFTSEGRERPWTSHVFLARVRAGELDPIDRREIESATWCTLARFRDDVAPVLRAAGWGRYAYRLHMASLVFPDLGLVALLPPG